MGETNNVVQKIDPSPELQKALDIIAPTLHEPCLCNASGLPHFHTEKGIENK